jgi:GNAT superfamily N-acetyltransferase
MADAALFIGFGRPARARERQALQVFAEARQFVGELEDSGEIESSEVVLLQPHGGDLSGFMLIRGSRDQMDALTRHDTFLRLTARATVVVDSFGVVPAYVGDGLGRWLDTYAAQVEEQLGS